MKLKLIRKYCKEAYTVGHLYIDDKYFCDTLEHPVVVNDIKGYAPKLKAIAYGTYPIILVQSPRFKTLVPLLQNVPNQHGIELHIGNSTSDSLGCILVGRNTSVGRLSESRLTFNNLMATIKNEKKLIIEITT